MVESHVLICRAAAWPITGCDDVAAQIEVNPGEHLSVPYDDVGRAVIQIELLAGRPPGRKTLIWTST